MPAFAAPAPEEWIEKYSPLPIPNVTYAAMVAAMDDAVGSVDCSARGAWSKIRSLHDRVMTNQRIIRSGHHAR
jgi:hypothetical protein